jgi:hypothetical protein
MDGIVTNTFNLAMVVNKVVKTYIFNCYDIPTMWHICNVNNSVIFCSCSCNSIDQICQLVRFGFFFAIQHFITCIITLEISLEIEAVLYIETSLTTTYIKCIILYIKISILVSVFHFTTF